MLLRFEAVDHRVERLDEVVDRVVQWSSSESGARADIRGGMPLLAACISLAAGNARVLHGVNLATMTALIVAEAALAGQVLVHGSLP